MYLDNIVAIINIRDLLCLSVCGSLISLIT
jgi:hypothetical protein